MDNYGKERQRQSSPPCKSSKFGYNDVDDGPDKDIEEADGGWGYHDGDKSNQISGWQRL